MTYAKSLAVFLNVLGVAAITGCGFGGMKPLPTPTIPTSQPTSVVFLSVPTTIAVNASSTIDAAATFPIGSVIDLAKEGVTYAVTCASAGACGTTGASSEVGAIVYTAPAAVPSGGTVTVTATSIVNPKLSRSATITVTPSIPITVAFSAPMPASLAVSSAVKFGVILANDVSSNPHVQWAVNCGGSDCGSLSSMLSSNYATVTFTAPASIPSGGTVTITATSVTDPTKSVSATVAITTQGRNLADGAYVFQISSPAAAQTNFITGAFVAKGGSITGGEQDWTFYQRGADVNNIGFVDAYSYSQVISGGSYGVTADGTIQISIQVGGVQMETLNGTLASGGHGFVAALDGVPATGTLDLQTSASPAGSYALLLFGGDRSGYSTWMGGTLNIDGAGTISGAGSVLEVLNGSSYGYGGKQQLGASTVSAPDAYGRVVFKLLPGNGGTIPEIDFAGYVIDATHIRLIETGDANAYSFGYGNFNGTLGGTAVGQGSAARKFSAASVAGSSYVFGAAGSDVKGALQIAGIFTLNSDGSVNGTLNRIDILASTTNGGQTTPKAQSPLAFTGSYTVDPNGRVSLTNLTDGSTFKYNLILYLGGNGGLLLSNDSNEIVTGQAYLRTSSTFSTASFSGNYGLVASVSTTAQSTSLASAGPVAGAVASVADAATDTLSGFADSGNASQNFAITGSFTAAANGVFQGTVSGFNPSARTTPANFTLYMVDATQGVAIETDATQLTLVHMEQVQ